MNRFARLVLLLAVAAFTIAPASLALACDRCGKPACCGPVCSYNPCIKYVDACRYKRCCECGPKIETVLLVKDPCTCCMVEVPVCLPACCTGEPCVDAKCGALGNGKVFFSWACGFEVKVILTKFGDITVVYLHR